MKNKLVFNIFAVTLSLVLILSGCESRIGGDDTSAASSGVPHTTASTSQHTVKDTGEPVTETTETEPPVNVSDSPLELDISAKQAFVYNLNKDEFLYLAGEGERLYPASTTKLLTITYALTLLSPDELITPGDELSLVGEFSTVAYVRPNHTLTTEMMIEGMLLPSGNDAAHALAAAAGRKLSSAPDGITGVEAVSLFVEGMNEYAVSIGMTGTHFISPDGYPNEDHYSTVEDMARIATIAAKNELIMKYSRLREANVTYESGHYMTWTNTNKLIHPDSGYYSPYVTGLKTGSAGDGNYSLIVTADIEGVTYVIGLFSEDQADTRFVDALAIIGILEELAWA